MPDVGVCRASADARGLAGQVFARSAVSVPLALVAALTFAFSFTNV